MPARDAARDTATFVSYYWEAYNQIVEPRRFDHYLIRRWSRDLGPLGFIIVKVLRDRCYHNPQTGTLRDTVEVDLTDLAEAVGVSRATVVRELARNEALGQFIRRVRQFRMVNGRPQKDANLYQVCMDDPIHPDDMEEYDLLRAQKEIERQPLPKTLIKRENTADPYKAQFEPNRDSYKAQIEPLETTSLSAQNESLETTSLSAQIEPSIDSLPSGGLTKESLTPQTADTPPINSPQGEGDALSQAWSFALPILAGLVNKPTFESHIKLLRPVSLVEAEGQVIVTLAAPSAFSQTWLREKKLDMLREALAKVLGRSADMITIEISRREK